MFAQLLLKSSSSPSLSSGSSSLFRCLSSCRMMMMVVMMMTLPLTGMGPFKSASSSNPHHFYSSSSSPSSSVGRGSSRVGSGGDCCRGRGDCCGARCTSGGGRGGQDMEHGRNGCDHQGPYEVRPCHEGATFLMRIVIVSYATREIDSSVLCYVSRSCLMSYAYVYCYSVLCVYVLCSLIRLV